MPALRVGDRMPRFSLLDADGAPVASESLLGRGPLVLYFYPKDDTPGCTVEACQFRDQQAEFAEAGGLVVGVSPDSPASHREFADRHHLPFLLLSDPERRVFDLYGVKGLLGLLPGRETFVIDREGIIRHHLRSAFRPRRHVREALQMVRQLR